MQIKSEVDNLVGMKKAQEEFENLRQIVGHVIKTGDREPLGKCLNLVLCQASIGGMYEVSLGFGALAGADRRSRHRQNDICQASLPLHARTWYLAFEKREVHRSAFILG